MPNDRPESQRDSQIDGDHVGDGAFAPNASAAESSNTDVESPGDAASGHQRKDTSMPIQRTLEELTISELVSCWLAAPRPTWRSLRMMMKKYPARNGSGIASISETLALAPSESLAERSSAFASLRAMPQKLRKFDRIEL